MKAKKSKSADTRNEKVEIFRILSAIWIMSCNDQIPMMTYQGIKYRLHISDDINVRSLIEQHGELFRQGVPERRLALWKRDMEAGRRLPSWIRDISDEEERGKAIACLSTNDVFRNQFRTERDAPRAPIEVLEWGIQHIDMLRKAELEERGAIAKSLEVRIAIAIGIVNFILAVIAMFLS